VPQKPLPATHAGEWRESDCRGASSNFVQTRITLRLRKTYLDSTLDDCDRRWVARQMSNVPRRQKIRQARQRDHSNKNQSPLNLQHVAFPRDHFIQHRIHKKSQQQPRKQSRDDHDRERLLCIRPNARRKRGRQQSQARHQCRHHDWTPRAAAC
jgi:hypothetical protein